MNPLPRQPVEYRDGALLVLDQTLLPWDERVLDLPDLAAVVEAIASLRVRGAPAIGIAAGYGLALALRRRLADDPALGLDAARAELARSRDALAGSRPTAVNLAAALARMARAESACCEGAQPGTSPSAVELLAVLEEEALRLQADEGKVTEAIVAAGLSRLPASARLLTHCNAGPLATGGLGTALGVILAGHRAGRRFEVFAGETRPLLQGARLTAWELGRAGVPFQLIPDSAGASLLLAGRVDAVIVGADRIACNGDTANKIGTLPLALAAARAGRPFYVAAPLSTFDPAALSGAAIPIETRDESEVLELGGQRLAAPGARAYNPAFDVTPADLITAFFTERGVLEPPYDFSGLGPGQAWP